MNKIISTTIVAIIKHRIPALCVIIMLISSTGLLVGCNSTGNGASVSDVSIITPGTVYSYGFANGQGISYDAGNSYSIESSGNVVVSYNDGKITAKAPLVVNMSFADNTMPGAYISTDKTAFSYCSEAGKPIQIFISDDMGKNWYISTIPYKDKEVGIPTKTFIGFTTKNNGWLVVCYFHQMASEYHYIYQTADGGKTWKEVSGNVDDIYPFLLTGANFSNDKIGFLSYVFYKTNFQPAIVWTTDGGITWQKLHVTLPAEFEKYDKTALSPSFNGANGLLPIQLMDTISGNIINTIYLKSNDYGSTWKYDASK